MNWGGVLRVLGYLLGFLALSMLLPLFWAWRYGTPDWAAFAVSIPAVGIPALLLSRNRSELTVGVRESYLIVTGGWVASSVAAAVPFVISGVLPHPVDAVFETMSGFTTTGATVIPNLEIAAAGIKFWRSYLHWLGGIGIIVIFLAFLPRVGLGGSFLFKAEVPGPEKQRLTPRLRQTAALLSTIYAVMTVAETTLLCLAGMSLYEAMIHTFGTVATGGFSTRNLSVGAFSNPWIHYIILVFMLLAGINFGLFYKMVSTRRMRFVFRDRELQLYLAIMAITVLIVGANLSRELGWAQALHHGSFQVVSIMTTTGFATTDFDAWPDLSRAVLLLLMFVGACSVSTGGSIKVVRHIVLFKSIFRELKRMVHSKAVLPLRIGEYVVPESTVRAVLVFTLAYVGSAVVGTMYLLGLGLDMVSAVSAAAATLGNVGPGLGVVGPSLSYSVIPVSGKILLSLLMLLGRLEVFTVLVTFAPAFWR